MIYYDVEKKIVRQSLGLVLGEFLRLDFSRNRELPVLMPEDTAAREQWERRLADPKQFWLERKPCLPPTRTISDVSKEAGKNLCGKLK